MSPIDLTLFNLPSPIQKVESSLFGNQFYVKREDLIHPYITGNKYRKLKYNLDSYQKGNYKGIITYGGAYSNHLHAVASLTNLYGIPTIGIVRGEEAMNNHILDYCAKAGMNFHKVNRESYKIKEQSIEIASILARYDNYMVLPEGGSNAAALLGVGELVDELLQSYDFIVVAAGTGSTAAGIIKRVDELFPNTNVIVFSSLKGAWIRGEIERHLGYGLGRHTVTDDYSLGGYAKVDKGYLDRLGGYKDALGFFIDKVYNGKLLDGVLSYINNGIIHKGASILWINTGGF
jgi:1-aminocyclopropane-1-carboxylate deaminase